MLSQVMMADIVLINIRNCEQNMKIAKLGNKTVMILCTRLFGLIVFVDKHSANFQVTISYVHTPPPPTHTHVPIFVIEYSFHGADKSTFCSDETGLSNIFLGLDLGLLTSFMYQVS